MWKTTLWTRITIVAALIVGLWLPAGESQAADSWEWSLTPYLWASSIGTKARRPC
jgi:hypothetical protein